MVYPPLRTDDVPQRRHHAAVPAGGTENAAAHSAALLRLQSDLGLGDIMLNFLYSDYGKDGVAAHMCCCVLCWLSVRVSVSMLLFVCCV